MKNRKLTIKELKMLGIVIGGFFLLIIIILGSGSSENPSPTINKVANNQNVQVQNTTTTEQKSSDSQVIEVKNPISQEIVKETNPQSTQSNEQYYLVTYVVDGDTFDINIDGTTERIRLIGIDTPETKDPRKPVQCFGVEASTKAKELLLNKKVKLIADPTQDTRDKYGRLLGYAFREDGLFFNKWMIENGYAYEYTYNVAYQYQKEFKQAQQYAENNKLGLWSPDTCNGDPLTNTTSQEPANQTQTEHKWYTSSHPSAKYYYCETDPGWEGLSEKYLKEFGSAEDLLSVYPSRTLHEPCK